MNEQRASFLQRHGYPLPDRSAHVPEAQRVSWTSGSREVMPCHCQNCVHLRANGIDPDTAYTTPPRFPELRTEEAVRALEGLHALNSLKKENIDALVADMIDPVSEQDELSTLVSKMYEEEHASVLKQEAQRHLTFWQQALAGVPVQSCLRFVRPASLDPVRPELIYVALRLQPNGVDDRWYITGALNGGHLNAGMSNQQLIALLVEWRVNAYNTMLPSPERIMPERDAIDASSRRLPEVKEESSVGQERIERYDDALESVRVQGKRVQREKDL